MKYTLEPVFVDGAVVLFDIFIDDVWHGSRRTAQQCTAYIAHLTRSSR